MLRILLVIAWVAVTVYALADWSRTSDEDCPARLNRQMWFLVILMTIPLYSLGSLAWIVLRLVAKAEAAGMGVPPVGPGRRGSASTGREAPLAPDDDPEFLFRLERDLQRKRREEEARRKEAEGAEDRRRADDETPDDSAPEGRP